MKKSALNMIMVMAISLAVTIFCTPPLQAQPSSRASTKREIRREVKRYREFLNLLHEHHLDTLDYHALTEEAMRGALSLCDPYSQYMSKAGGEALNGQIESAPIKSAYMIDSVTLCIKVELFSRNISDMILEKYREMGSPRSLVLDLRGNQGGFVREAINTSELFMSRGEVIFTRKGRTVPLESFRARGDGELQDLELMVVMDGKTASASEIVVGALKDNERAVVAGEESFGKGLIMRQYYFGDKSSVLIAIAHYITPHELYIQRPYKGRSIDKSLGGIKPIIEHEFGEVIDLEDVEVMRKNIANYN